MNTNELLLTYDTPFFTLQQFLIQQSELQSSKSSCVHFLETERSIMRDANWLSHKQCGVSFNYQWSHFSHSHTFRMNALCYTSQYIYRC